jgi:dipeptidyl aminopeptidase/acylaminoacyl peptidase
MAVAGSALSAVPLQDKTVSPADPISGEWAVTFKVHSTTTPAQFKLKVDGERVTGTAYSHIWIVDAATGAARKLAAHDQPYLDETPSWFPDGKHIAFQSNRTGRMEVWVMNADGSGQLQVTGVK